MERSRCSEEQIIAILKEYEAGVSVADLCRKELIERLQNQRLCLFGDICQCAPLASDHSRMNLRMGQERMNASRSAFITSAWVVIMPCEKPG
jgi:hypothetical protein